MNTTQHATNTTVQPLDYDRMVAAFNRVPQEGIPLQNPKGLGPIVRLLTHAAAGRLKHPRVEIADPSDKLRGMSLRLAGTTIFVDLWDNTNKKTRWEFAGHILATAEFKPAEGCPETVLPALERLAANPYEVLVGSGRLTGRCSCCSRKLRNPVSVRAGIGRICADRIRSAIAQLEPQLF